MKKTFLLVAIIFSSFILAQDNIGVKFFGLSIHPKGEKINAHLMPLKFDENAVFVMNLGGMLSYEKFIWEDRISAKIVTALYSDCASMLGGFEHIGVRFKIFKYHKHSLYAGFGPTLIFRKNWNNLKDYQDPKFFSENGAYQYKFLWYGGEIEYKYKLTDKLDLSSTFVPGYPHLMSLSFGVSYNLPK